MRYGALFQAQCASLRRLRSEDEVSMASSFVFAWRASVVNESLGPGEGAERDKQLQYTGFELAAAHKVVQLSFLFLFSQFFEWFQKMDQQTGWDVDLFG